VRWVTEITDWHPPHRFVDVQRRGPYRLWQHTHEFEAVNGGTRMRDSVHYALPWGVLGRLAHNLIVQRDLNTIFDYRSRHVSAWFDRQASTNSGPSSPSADASD
jgi:ligand-binding SRPBCC domain-containing protein